MGPLSAHSDPGRSPGAGASLRHGLQLMTQTLVNADSRSNEENASFIKRFTES